MNAELVLVDDDERTWPMRESRPVILDDRGLVVGAYGASHSEALTQARGDSLSWDATSVAAQLAPNGEVYVLPEGDKGPAAERVLAALRGAQSGRSSTDA